MTRCSLQVLLSGAELGCSQEALTIVAVASTDPIYFTPRYAHPPLPRLVSVIGKVYIVGPRSCLMMTFAQE